MTLAKILLKLWALRRWVAVGVLLAAVAAVGSVASSHSTVYASASTQMLVDAQTSALANSEADITGYTARANVFARLMTSAEALQYIGKAAGIPGNLIDANGPIEINGSPTATHAPVAIANGKDQPAPALYELSFVQNPTLPTVDVFAKAPTTAQAIALANGAVTGFADYISQLNGNTVPLSKRVDIRQLGGATGGMVDVGASKKIAALAFFAILLLWCGGVLFASRLRADLRAAKQTGTDDLFSVPAQEPVRVPQQELFEVLQHDLPSVYAPAREDNLPRVAPVPDARVADADGNHFHRALATARVQPRP